jgi:prepilin-type processing-associated H-X9-DG protein
VPNESSFLHTPEETRPRRKGRFSLPVLLALGIVAVLIGIPAIRWQQISVARVSCLTNERRLASALMLYSQDHNGCLPPTEIRTANGWKSWINLADPYIRAQEIVECASNSARGAKHATLGYSFPYSYALNERFFGVFSPGPFPVENLEIPEQTVLLAESGWQRSASPFGPPERPLAMSAYTDTGLNPTAYPSPHDGRMNLVAADWHAKSLRIAHYGTAGHDTRYGRVGGALYNWNGGHANGDTASPPHE